MPADFGLTHPPISISPTFMGAEKSQPFVFGEPPKKSQVQDENLFQPLSGVTPGPKLKNPSRFRQTTRQPDEAFQSFKEIEKDGSSKSSEEFPLSSDAKANTETQEIKILIEGEQDRSRGSSQVLHIPVMIEEEEEE